MIIEDGTDLSYFQYNNTGLNNQVVLTDVISATDVTDMHFAFAGCTNITDFTTYQYSYSIYSYTSTYTYSGEYIWDNVGYTYTYKRYYHCSYEIPQSFVQFNGGYIKDMNHMFLNCYNLTIADLSYFDLSDCLDMSNMFENCYNLKSVAFGRYKPNINLNVENIFKGCYNLSYVYIPSELFSYYRNIFGQADLKGRLYPYSEANIIPNNVSYHIINEIPVDTYTTITFVKINNILIDNTLITGDIITIKMYLSDTPNNSPIYNLSFAVNTKSVETYIENVNVSIDTTILDDSSFMLCVELLDENNNSIKYQTYKIVNNELNRYMEYNIYTIAFLDADVNDMIINTPYAYEYELADYNYNENKQQVFYLNESEYNADEQSLYIKTFNID